MMAFSLGELATVGACITTVGVGPRRADWANPFGHGGVTKCWRIAVERQFRAFGNRTIRWNFEKLARVRCTSQQAKGFLANGRPLSPNKLVAIVIANRLPWPSIDQGVPVIHARTLLTLVSNKHVIPQLNAAARSEWHRATPLELHPVKPGFVQPLEYFCFDRCCSNRRPIAENQPGGRLTRAFVGQQDARDELAARLEHPESLCNQPASSRFNEDVQGGIGDNHLNAPVSHAWLDRSLLGERPLKVDEILRRANRTGLHTLSDEQRVGLEVLQL
jgi:hypothetical protein